MRNLKIVKREEIKKKFEKIYYITLMVKTALHSNLQTVNLDGVYKSVGVLAGTIVKKVSEHSKSFYYITNVLKH